MLFLPFHVQLPTWQLIKILCSFHMHTKLNLPLQKEFLSWKLPSKNRKDEKLNYMTWPWKWVRIKLTLINIIIVGINVWPFFRPWSLESKRRVGTCETNAAQVTWDHKINRHWKACGKQWQNIALFTSEWFLIHKAGSEQHYIHKSF